MDREAARRARSREALEEVLGDTVEVRVVVDARAAELSRRQPPRPSRGGRAGRADPAAEAGAGRPGATARRAAGDLNPRYVFDRFVTGPNNEYATAVARSVAESPATAYNPVFIYADTGLGKTHLIQAIAHAALEQHPDLAGPLRHLSSASPTTSSTRSPTRAASRASSRPTATTTCCIIDDVQFLAEKQQTQVEFFHTFNALYEAGKQIVITSDRPPRELEELEERLRSRFGQGVVVDIGRPDLETRIAILRKQVKWEGFKIAEPEVARVDRPEGHDQHPRALRRAHARRRLRLDPAAPRSRSRSPRRRSRTSSPRRTSTR